jgi:hypothetical protein
MTDKWKSQALNSVVRVGDGRGFVVEGRPLGLCHRYIVTAGHCLPFVPPCFGASYLAERTYKKLLARLGEQPSIWCECCFIDPVADIAVLCAPDNQELSVQADGYEALVEAAATPLRSPSRRASQLLRRSRGWLT